MTLTAIISCILLQISSYAPLKEVFTENPLLATGNYREVVLDAPAPTKAPKGFKPYYISSYTRHGARTFSRNAVYDTVMDLLAGAEKERKLTDAGREFLEIYQEIYDKSIGGSSDLTQIGAKQHHDLAARTFKDYPEVFKGRNQIDARSTVRPRCILSMASFCGSLKEQRKGLEVTMQASPKHTYILNPNSSDSPKVHPDLEGSVMESPASPFWADYKEMWRTKTDPEKYFSRLFTDYSWVTAHCPDVYEMLKNFYYMTGIEQCCTGRHELMKFATPDEMEAMFECENFRFYGVCGNNKYYGGRNWALCEGLLQDIIDYAEQDMDSDIAARLRFGHDFRIMSLMTLLDADGFEKVADAPDEVKDVFRFYDTPMAANVLFVFYRNKAGEVLVKLTLNGTDKYLPIEGAEGPFYTWEAFRDYCNERIAVANRLLGAA